MKARIAALAIVIGITAAQLVGGHARADWCQQTITYRPHLIGFGAWGQPIYVWQPEIVWIC